MISSGQPAPKAAQWLVDNHGVSFAEAMLCVDALRAYTD